MKRLSARDNTYRCHVALQAIGWPCKLWGAPAVSKLAGMHALSLTLPKLHLATLKKDTFLTLMGTIDRTLGRWTLVGGNNDLWTYYTFDIYILFYTKKTLKNLSGGKTFTLSA